MVKKRLSKYTVLKGQFLRQLSLQVSLSDLILVLQYIFALISVADNESRILGDIPLHREVLNLILLKTALSISIVAPVFSDIIFLNNDHYFSHN